MKMFIKISHFFHISYSLRGGIRHSDNICFFRSFYTKFFVCILICFPCKTVFSASAELTEKISSFDLYLKGVDFPDTPIEITLKGNEVDISSLLSVLEKVKESPYDNFNKLEKFFPKMAEKVTNLCKHSDFHEDCARQAYLQTMGTVSDIYQEMQEHILYPESYQDYHLFTGQGDAFYSFTQLNLDCVENCSDWNIREVIQGGSNDEYFAVYETIKDKSERCQQNVLGKLAKELEKEEIPKKCLQKEHKSHPVCNNMLKYVTRLKDRIADLTDMAYGRDTLKITEAQASCEVCTFEGESKNIHIWSDFVSSLNEHTQCGSLEEGEEKRVYSGTKLNRSYDVQRESDGTYSIPLSLKFSAGENYDGDVQKEQVHDHYMNRVQKCMDKANEKMLGPDGEKLKILIKNPEKQDKNNCKNKTKEIKISSKYQRSYATEYRSNIDCPTILHEVLHLLGLCDEYKDSYACRVTTQNSIMSDHSERWDNVFKEGKNDSLLTSGQFNAILYGSCEGKNKLFNECSQLAYKNPSQEPNCRKQKKQCEAQNSLGGLDEQEE